MFSTVRCHFTERRLMTRSCFITPASPPQSHDEQVAHLPHIGPGFLPPDDTSHSSDKKDINNVDSLVLMRDNFSMVTSYGVGPLPRPFLEASDSVILKVFGQTSQSLRRTWLGERR